MVASNLLQADKRQTFCHAEDYAKR